MNLNTLPKIQINIKIFVNEECQNLYKIFTVDHSKKKLQVNLCIKNFINTKFR